MSEIFLVAFVFLHFLNDPRHARVLVEVPQRHRSSVKFTDVVCVRDD